MKKTRTVSHARHQPFVDRLLTPELEAELRREREEDQRELRRWQRSERERLRVRGWPDDEIDRYIEAEE